MANFGNSIYKRYVYISRCAQFICCGKKTSFVNIDPATLDEMRSGSTSVTSHQSRRKSHKNVCDVTFQTTHGISEEEKGLKLPIDVSVHEQCNQMR
jgi:hypothetical protein